MLMMNEKIAYDFLFFYLFFEKKNENMIKKGNAGLMRNLLFCNSD